MPGKSREYCLRGKVGPPTYLLTYQKHNFDHHESELRMNSTDKSKLKKRSQVLFPRRKPTKAKGCAKAFEDISSNSDNPGQENIHLDTNLGKTVKTDADGLPRAEFINAVTDPTLRSEWVPPNLSDSILDLIDVIFQLQDGGWIRRKAFRVAKQILQLGMGVAFDDWLIEKIQILRRGSVVASGIKRLEEILWPDGIFITKHPKRQQPTYASPSCDSPQVHSCTLFSSPKIDDVQNLEEMQQKEADRRAKFVYELMIDKAPAAIVGLVGRKEYEKCAQDLYYFIQSPICMKQLAFYLLELILLPAFPELDYVFKRLHEETDKFGRPEFNAQN